MISYCTAVSREEAADLLRAYTHKGRSPVEGHGYVAWIGIGEHHSPLLKFPQQRQLILHFADATHPTDRDPPQPNEEPAPGIIERADAEQIVRFAKALQEDHRPWALLVHCFAGISRSPAVALWVREHFRVGAPDVSRHLYWPSSGWRPNATVARLLREVAR